jgi:thiamine biosynthesis lipoprotein
MMFSKNSFIVRLIKRSGILLLLFYFVGCETPQPLTGWSGMTMGTTYQVKIAKANLSDNQLQNIRSNVDSALKEVNRQMSTYDPGSEISRFNKSDQTTAFEVSAEFANVVKKALQVYHSSDRVFDITVAPLINLWGFGSAGHRITPPTKKEIGAMLNNIGSHRLEVVNGRWLKKSISHLQLDLGAIAKGYGVDVVSMQLQKNGFTNFMVEIGGEVYARGEKNGEELWRIGIDTPMLASMPGQDLQAILALKDVAIATSGDYRNYFEYDGKIYSHTINPKTGNPVDHNLASVTVIANNCMEADALATAIMVMGKDKGLQFIEITPNAEAYFIVRIDKETYETFKSSGFDKYLQD